ncbi:MaoC/PaaZ C-terminal domain-containing protein [Kribbella endophytica]
MLQPFVEIDPHPCVGQPNPRSTSVLKKLFGRANAVLPRRSGGGPFHGLIASGWHTASLMMRLYAKHYLSHVASLGGPGVDELRWLVPVRPGDQLRLRTTVLEARLSRSKPDRGLVRTLAELLNQDDVVVLRVEALNFLAVRVS